MKTKAQRHSKGFYPLAVNILHLQESYSGYFEVQEIIVFEWFIVKASSFRKRNFKEFFYSIRRISEETFIRKAKLNTIIKRFAELGIISYTTKGMPKQHHFQVNVDKVLELLPTIYKLTEKDKLLAFFNKLLTGNSQHKEYYKNNNQEYIREEKIGLPSEKGFSDGHTTSNNTTARNLDLQEEIDLPRKTDISNERTLLEDEKNELQESEQYQKILNDIYKRRIEMFNANPGNKHGKQVTKLAFTHNSKLRLVGLFRTYDTVDIEASFSAFVDEFIKDPSKIKKPIPYFLQRSFEDEFSVFLTFLDKFNTQYSYNKPHVPSVDSEEDDDPF